MDYQNILPGMCTRPSKPRPRRWPTRPRHLPVDPRRDRDRGVRGETEAFQPGAEGSCASPPMCSFSAEKVSKVITRITKWIRILVMVCTLRCPSQSSHCGRRQPANQGMLHEAFKPETETEALTHETEARPRRDRGVEARDRGEASGRLEAASRPRHWDRGHNPAFYYREKLEGEDCKVYSRLVAKELSGFARPPLKEWFKLV